MSKLAVIYTAKGAQPAPPHHQCVVLPLRHWHGTQPKRRGQWHAYGHEYSDCILLYILVALTSVAEFRFEL